MKTIIQQIAPQDWGITPFSLPDLFKPSWILVFGSRELLSAAGIHQSLERQFPDAVVTYGSTAGEIIGSNFSSGYYNLAFIEFATTRVQAFSLNRSSFTNCKQLGARLVQALPTVSLSHIFLLADGQHINGSELLEGVRSKLPSNVQVSGGMAGDGEQFQETRVGLNADPQSGEVLAVGLYGTDLVVKTGSSGGFDSFGVDRLITKSSHNQLFELDGQSALSLYKKYLGPLTKGLPGTALLFPLMIKSSNGRHLARTILSIDHEKESLTFAGDIPQGDYARLMRTNPERLIDAAYEAAQQSKQPQTANLAILVSCVGRKLVLEQRVDEELEAVQETLGPQTSLFGFYSYGEVCPHTQEACELHNQTMTITTLSEKSDHSR